MASKVLVIRKAVLCPLSERLVPVIQCTKCGHQAGWAFAKTEGLRYGPVCKMAIVGYEPTNDPGDIEWSGPESYERRLVDSDNIKKPIKENK